MQASAPLPASRQLCFLSRVLLRHLSAVLPHHPGGVRNRKGRAYPSWVYGRQVGTHQVRSAASLLFAGPPWIKYHIPLCCLF